VVIGLAGLVATSRLDYRRLRPLAVWILGVAVVLLVAVFIPGIGIQANGSSRWIGVGVATFQPSELAKLAVILYGSVLLSSRPVDDLRLTVLPLAVVLGVVGALVYAEPDLGTTVILGAIAVSLLFFAGLRLAIVGATAALGVGVLGALTMTAGYRRNRVMSMFDPWSDPLITGWQAIQAGVAISNGGLWGLGLGASRAKWGFLPFAQTDFIFAIVAEELGFVAAMGVILVYLVIGVCGLTTALRAPDRFGQLLAAGITTWIMIQAYVNIGAVLGVLPITGVPLPLVSYGGSSMVLTLTAYGVLLNVARQTP
jgi:cell division protein FtsW